jgi:2-oxoglutarate dehydrogenase E1 component
MVLDDPNSSKKSKRILLCFGKVYYDLAERRDEQDKKDTAIIRLEQLYPFPQDQLKKILDKYKETKEWFWVQEETENRGAWTFIREQFLKHYQQNISYIGRPSSASPATGSHTEHVEELEQILSKALP